MADGSRPADEMEQASTELAADGAATSSLLRELARAPELPGGRFSPGARLGGGRYTIVRLIGTGGMGRVYLATDELLRRPVALKLVQDRVAGELRRLRDEVTLAQKVTHAGVCRTHDLEELEGQWVVKMEYIDGETLAARLRRGPLAVAEATGVAAAVCGALAAAHRQGVVHRDLKPANIMIDAATGRVVLMDFGVARPPGGEGELSGTPDYMAPEQVRGRAVDGRADLYALGCVLHEMLSGERVFPRPSPAEAALAHVNDPPPALPDRLPGPLRRLVGRLLEKDPARRPATAEEVAAALAGPRRRRAVVAAALVAAAAAVALVATRPAARWQPQIRDLQPYDESSTSVAISPDGTMVAYTSDRDDRYRVYVEPVAGGPARALTPPGIGYIDEIHWQRDGQALLFDAGLQVYRVPLSGGPPELLGPGGAAVDCGVGLLFSRGRLIGGRNRVQLVLRALDGREREIVTFPVGVFPSSVRCDAPGRRAVFATTDAPRWGAHEATDVSIIDLAGGPPRQLTTDHAGYHGTFAASGESLIVSSTRGGQAHIWELRIDGRAEPRQLTFGSGGEHDPDVSADGRLLVYNIGERSSQLFAQPLDGSGAPRRLCATMDEITIPRPTPDGREIIAQASRTSSAPAAIVRIPAAGGEPVHLVEGEMPAVTPDGREVVYVVDKGRVMAIPRAGGAPRLVTVVPGVVRYPHIDDDGLVHMVVMRNGLEAWRAPLAGGVAVPELPRPWGTLRPAPRSGWRVAITWIGGFGKRHARFLPPGATFEDPGAREVDLDGKSAWMPDGLSLLYAPADDTIHRFFVETGHDEIVARGVFDDVAVSPDGAVLYTTRWVTQSRRAMVTNLAQRPPL